MSLERSQDLLRQRRVEVIWDRERPCTEAERSRTGLSGGDGPQLGDRSATADYDEAFPCLNPVQESARVPLELL